MSITCAAPVSGGCGLPALANYSLCAWHADEALRAERQRQDQQQAIADGYVPQKPNTELTSRINAASRQARKQKAGSREAT